MRKSRKCGGHQKRTSKTKTNRSDNKTCLAKDIASLKGPKYEDSNKNELDESCSAFYMGHISSDCLMTKECDKCDVCSACRTKLNQHKIISNETDNDKPSPASFDRKYMFANDTHDVAWRSQVFCPSTKRSFALNSDLEQGDNFDKNTCDDGKIVCTLVVPSAGGWTSLYDHVSLNTSDSDKDSGFCSEQNSVIETRVASCTDNYEECFTRDDETKYNHHDILGEETRDTCKDDKTEQGNEYPLPLDKSKSPFERKVWKRKNGWYKVRNPICPRLEYNAAINYGDHEAEFGSERSEQSSRDSRENVKFLPDTKSTEEFDVVMDTEKMIFNKGTSGGAMLKTENKKETIESNNQRSYHGYLSEFQIKLEQMKIEIAEMVAEAAELDNTLGDSDDDIDDISLHKEHWNMDSDDLYYFGTESRNSESDEDVSEDTLSDYGDDYSQYYSL